MSRTTAIDLCYLIAAISFILALKGLSSPKRARWGNLVGAGGMVLAVAATFARPGLSHIGLIVAAMVVGAAIGVPAARMVKMTAMPQMVAAFNGVGGGAAALVSITELLGVDTHRTATYRLFEVLFGVLVGAVAFSGSAMSFAKLQELMTGRPITYPRQQVINATIAGLAAAISLAILLSSSIALVWVLLVVALVLGVILVLPIGGADVPVLISLLNSFTGLAVAASGFVLDNNLLIVSGTLVGASGALLTRMMSRAMGRSLPNILFSAFGSAPAGSGSSITEDRVVRAGQPNDIGILMAYARSVVIVPGYGLAVAQAQHVVHELAQALASRGVSVFYAIHPVAGRMPGHMNVLLAEAQVPYEELLGMEEANPKLPGADVALVVGANDTVNPAARSSPRSPIYGMPIIDADQASHVVVLKRSMRPGFSGIDNDLLYDPKTTLLFGDAKDTLTKLVSAVARA